MTPSGGPASGGRRAIRSGTGHLPGQLDTAGTGSVVTADVGDGWRAKAVVLD
jgi:hypothetical protein